MRGISVASEDYYPAITLTILREFLRKPFGTLAPVRKRIRYIRILRERQKTHGLTVVQLQPMVIEAVMTVFKSLGLKCVPYLKHFLPLFIHVMKVIGDSIPGLRELTFHQLRHLVSLIKHYTRDFLEELFQVNSFFLSFLLLFRLIETNHFSELLSLCLDDKRVLGHTQSHNSNYTSHPRNCTLTK
jgi:hypothetical protein